MFSSGSQVLSSPGYPAQYSGLHVLILLRIMRSAEKMSGSLRILLPRGGRRGVSSSFWFVDRLN